MLKIYDPVSARQTLLKRVPLDEQPVPSSLLSRLEATFGEPLTPAEAVRRILHDVRTDGDAALRRWTLKLDGVDLPAARVPAEKLTAALSALDPALRAALAEAAARIEAFYRKQPLISWMDQNLGGTLGQVLRPIERVGFYIPGGTAPLPSTVLMSVIPARVAGVSQPVIVTPPARGSGEINPVILAAAALVGVDEVYAAGGAQAIGLLAYGSETVRPVDKIVGPGNLFVTLAKQQVFGTVGIDGLAGPTETVVIADDSANPKWVAADLLAQAEHDVLAAAILLTPSQKLIDDVEIEIQAFLDIESPANLTRREIIVQSLQNRSGAVLTRDIAEAVALANAYAPEHLNLAVRGAWDWLPKVQNSGGVFLGETSCEVMGDYIAGPSHVMPTGGSARFASPLNVWDFVRIISVIGLDQPTAARLGAQAEKIALSEQLNAHALAAHLRASKQ
jgi:histidinol dehydrogenase